MEPSLQGRVAVVTGASRGIGAAIVEGYALQGAVLVGLGRDRERLQAVGQRVAAAGGRFEWVVADVTDEEALAAGFAHAVRVFGGVDIVVANAGIDPSGSSVADTAAGLWERTLATNVIGVASTIRLAVPYLRLRGGGHIISIGSGLGRYGLPGSAVYATSKAALTRLTQVAAAELAGSRIAVNELIPGPVDTDGARARHQQGQVTVTELFPEEWRKEPDDVVPLAVFLATQPSHGPTGQSFSLMRR